MQLGAAPGAPTNTTSFGAIRPRSAPAGVAQGVERLRRREAAHLGGVVDGEEIRHGASPPPGRRRRGRRTIVAGAPPIDDLRAGRRAWARCTQARPIGWPSAGESQADVTRPASRPSTVHRRALGRAGGARLGIVHGTSSSRSSRCWPRSSAALPTKSGLSSLTAHCMPIFHGVVSKSVSCETMMWPFSRRRRRWAIRPNGRMSHSLPASRIAFQSSLGAATPGSAARTPARRRSRAASRGRARPRR